MHRLAPDPGIREGFASSGIRNPSHFAVEFGNLGLEFGIQLEESGIPLMIEIRNPSST